MGARALAALGDIILIFDFVRADIAQQILNGMIAVILDDVTSRQGIRVTLSRPSVDRLTALRLLYRRALKG